MSNANDALLALAEQNIAELEAENTKLRELCTDMWRFTGAACKKYPRLFDPAAQGPQTVQLNALDSFEHRSRRTGNRGARVSIIKLGVELPA